MRRLIFVLVLVQLGGCHEPASNSRLAATECMISIDQVGHTRVRGCIVDSGDLAAAIRACAAVPASVSLRIEDPETMRYGRLHAALQACWDAGLMMVQINGVPIKLSWRPHVDEGFTTPFPSFVVENLDHVDMFRLIDRFEHPNASLACGPDASVPLLMETLKVAHQRQLPVGLILAPKAEKLGIRLLAAELVHEDPARDARQVLILDVSGTGAEKVRTSSAHGFDSLGYVLRTTEKGFEESTSGFTRITPETYRKHVVDFGRNSPILQRSVLAPALRRAFEELDKQIAAETPWQTKYRPPRKSIIIETGAGLTDWAEVKQVLSSQPVRKNVVVDIHFRSTCPKAVYQDREELAKVCSRNGIQFWLYLWGDPKVTE